MGVVGCLSMMLQRLQDTVTSGGQDYQNGWHRENEAGMESPASLKSHPGNQSSVVDRQAVCVAASCKVCYIKAGID